MFVSYYDKTVPALLYRDAVPSNLKILMLLVVLSRTRVLYLKAGHTNGADDGITTAYGPKGQVLHSHSPPMPTPGKPGSGE